MNDFQPTFRSDGEIVPGSGVTLARTFDETRYGLPIQASETPHRTPFDSIRQPDVPAVPAVIEVSTVTEVVPVTPEIPTKKVIHIPEGGVVETVRDEETGQPTVVVTHQGFSIPLEAYARTAVEPVLEVTLEQTETEPEPEPEPNLYPNLHTDWKPADMARVVVMVACGEDYLTAGLAVGRTESAVSNLMTRLDIGGTDLRIAFDELDPAILSSPAKALRSASTSGRGVRKLPRYRLI
jgi:hypothetical protein